MSNKIDKQYKRYIVFGYDEYYPHGGFHDVKGNFDDIEAARDFVSKHYDDSWENYHIFDCLTRRIIDYTEWED